MPGLERFCPAFAERGQSGRMGRPRRGYSGLSACAWALAAVLPACSGALAAGSAREQSPPDTRTPVEQGSDIVVNNAADSGGGSLRQAILDASAQPGPHTIRLDPAVFSEQKVLRLAAELPALTGELTIDGRIEGVLWRATGLQIAAEARGRIFSVAEGARVTISALTLTGGRAEDGGAILNRGNLALKESTLTGNVATRDGGAVANEEGTLTVVNSTFAENTAERLGGGLSSRGGSVTVTSSTFSGNAAGRGGGLFSDGSLLVRNSILANSGSGGDCVGVGPLDPATTHNLIEHAEGCGVPLSTDDPRLGRLGQYNGPTPTLPLEGGSPALNRGDNASALDEQGRPLVWDQRGNGDPRDVAGITDLGAFESQYQVDLTVDSVEDADLRGCSRAPRDCSLRGAITLANASRRHDRVGFDEKVFAARTILTFREPLPEVSKPLILEASGTARVVLRCAGAKQPVLRAASGVSLRLERVEVE